MGCAKYLILQALLLILVSLGHAAAAEPRRKQVAQGRGPGHTTLNEMQEMFSQWKGKQKKFPVRKPGIKAGCPEEENEPCSIYNCQTNSQVVELYASFLRARGKARADDLWEPENMTAETVSEVREKVGAFMEHRPKYQSQSGLFKGKGIVIVGGGGIYETPSWIAIHAIRRAGSELPIEIWYPAEEIPSCNRIEQLEKLDVRVRTFSELVDKEEELKIEKFMLKIFALVFSSFEETLLLDSDVVVVQNPDSLFHEPLYRQHGTLFWKDFWNSSSCPAFQSIFGHKTKLNYSHESGQSLVNKGARSTWDALMLALYMNSYGPQFFYPLSVNYMGLGDKEILPLSILALNQEYGLVEDGPDHVGLPHASTVDQQWSETKGNTMMQHKPNGEPMFMHANLFKMSTSIPLFSFQYERRWQSSLLHGRGIKRLVKQYAGVDLEMWCYDLIVQNHCLFAKDHKYWVRSYSPPPGMFISNHENINTDLKVAKVLIENGKLSV